jgi:hypothetical protein
MPESSAEDEDSRGYVAGAAADEAGCPFDPLVAALAQLVRDRWAAEQSDPKASVASGRVPSNMASVTTQPAEAADPPE